MSGELIGYFLAFIWGAAVVVGAIAFAINSWDDFGNFGGSIASIIIGPIILLFAVFPAALISQATSPILATLHKGEWACGFGHFEMRMAGKVPVKTFICDQYNHER